MDFTLEPDWTDLCTLNDFAAKFQVEGFKGPGWYLCNGDTCLIVGVSSQEKYRFFVWNGRDPRPIMKACLSLPEHVLTQIPG